MPIREQVNVVGPKGKLAGRLHLPDADAAAAVAGVLVAGAWTSVKEQMSDRGDGRLIDTVVMAATWGDGNQALPAQVAC
ncbi:hypothetical protein AB0C93_19475 [Streptomyces sp. NPDC048518]|uniref:hypothetical protein n=1 Tax=Streptomyces sp. NPDC048518 TaxID=3155029 RepID=UPI0033FE9778